MPNLVTVQTRIRDIMLPKAIVWTRAHNVFPHFSGMLFCMPLPPQKQPVPKSRQISQALSVKRSNNHKSSDVVSKQKASAPRQTGTLVFLSVKNEGSVIASPKRALPFPYMTVYKSVKRMTGRRVLCSFFRLTKFISDPF